MEGIKVVSAEEMVRIEEGGDPERYMEMAGRKVAEAAIRYIEAHRLSKKITLLVGKGNNGGDAYAAGVWLLEEGYHVQAYALYEEVSPLNRKFRERFRKRQGRFEKGFEGLILDGLLGTGFKGKLEKQMAAVIQEANASNLPILAIDIPSGLNGTTGEVGEVAIVAAQTIALGFAKIGFFIQQGWNHVGELSIADFGLSKERVAEAEAIAYLPLCLELPKIARIRHKYQAGYVIGYAGSKCFPGAAKMAGFAALKGGAGIVRIFCPEEIGPAPLELICHVWDVKAWEKELVKANAVFIGPGLTESATPWLNKHLKKIKKPCVIDADALLPHLNYPKRSILTPHRGEVLRLLRLKTAPKDEELFAQIIRFCERKAVYLVLKGSPTIVFGPKHKPIIIPRGDPGMATAGTGDILTGLIAALLSQACEPYEAAVLGATLHAIAGEMAAKKKTSYCMTATDLFEFMPDAFQAVMHCNIV